MKNARNQHRTDYAKELIKIVQTTKDREELKKKIAAYHERGTRKISGRNAN